MKYNMKSFKIYFMLLIFIVLLFVILNLVYSNNTMYIDVFGKRLKSNDEILIKNEEEYYLSFDFVKNNIDDEIYFDNVSKKVVISEEKCLLKAKLNEKSVTINFNKEDIISIGVIQNERIYISLEMLKKAYDVGISICNNTIYIYNKNSFECALKTNKIGMYIESNSKSKIVDYVYKSDKIIGIFENEEFVFVKVNEKDVGYILKNKLSYSIEYKKEEKETIENKVYIFADNNIESINKNLSVDGVLINMFDVIKQDGSISEKNTNKKVLNILKRNNMKIYGIVTNGYNLAGFTTSTITQILSDESKRMILINNLNEKMQEYNLEGIVIDFRMIKDSDINNYIQFVKEFDATTEKDVIVNIDANEYKNYVDIINYSDYSILNIYGRRNLNSTVSGSVSEPTWMEDVIDEILDIAHPEKVIIGIPAYSILWTEKNSNVVNAEIYNLKAMEEYINKNKLEKKYSEAIKQNYVELKKGSLVYRMWLEDEMTIENRVKVVKDNKLLGVAIYKLGYENEAIINMANTIK